MGYISIMEGILQNKNYKLYYNITNYHKIFTTIELSNLLCIILNWHTCQDYIEYVIQWLDFQKMNSVISYWIV